jgi:hypothetical protein
MAKQVIKKAPKKQNDPQKEATITELIETFNKLEFTVRIEKGRFKGGFCLLRADRLFLLNKDLEQDKMITYLARNLASIGIDKVFVKPNLRDLIEKELTNDE